MTRKWIWIGLGGLLVVLASWLGYRAFRQPGSAIDPFIPDDALLVLESTALQNRVPLRTLQTEMPLRQMPVFQEAVQRLERFLYAAGDTTAVLRFLADKPVYYSLHPVAGQALDFVFYLPLRPGQDQAFLNTLTTPDPRLVRVLSHHYNQESITELRNLKNEVFGSYLLAGNYLIGSASGILIENVVRQLHQPLTRRSRFRLSTDHLASFSVRPEVLRALFSNTEATGSLVSLFLPEELNLQFRTSISRTHLIGYATDEIGSRQAVAGLFAGQTPRRIVSAGLIPQTTASLYHIGLSDAARFGRNMADLLSASSSPSLQERLQRIRQPAGEIYQHLGQDIVLCRLEAPAGEMRQVLLLKAADVKKLSEAFQRTGYQAGAGGLPLTLKTFLGHKTLLLDVPELPASLFSNLFAGFRQSWVTQHNDYLVVANSEEALQDYLRQLESGAVWAADKNQETLLTLTLRPANFTAFVQVNRAGTVLPAHWPAGWRNLLNHADPSLGNIEHMVYQASYGKEKILSTLVLGRTTRRAGNKVLNRLLLQKKFMLDAPPAASPLLVTHRADGQWSIWVQNQANQLVVLTTEGEKQEQGYLTGPVRSNMLAVDYLDNGRLQYLFMTDRMLYVADPGEQSLRLRPIPLPAGLTPAFLALPKGSRRRNLVALAAHRDGSIYALDRQNNRFTRLFAPDRPEALLLPFQVSSTADGMEVLGLQPSGLLNRWVETGRQASHFPARLTAGFASPALEPGPAAGIRLITEQGELLRLNNNGLIAERSQLYRPVRSGSFRLCPDDTQTSYILLRTTDTEIAVLDQQGQQRFDVRGLKPGNQVQYHRLEAGVELISVKSGRFTTLYALDGRVIGDRAIPSDFPVRVQFSAITNQLYVLSGTGNTVQLFSIRLR
ncbi:hypothetical protein GCM10023187_54200 [Nibrella viscosa]|uniref:Uncharacterized protein n=1 Tax=Nibrella viscosa TaxID=1084524 RepID=A0ABP8L0A8_9BACT